MSELTLLNSHKELYEFQLKANRMIIRGFLRSIPKQMLIEELKDLKIIKRDWEKEGEQYNEK